MLQDKQKNDNLQHACKTLPIKIRLILVKVKRIRLKIMAAINGKTYTILKRLPHFFDPYEAGPTLVQLVEVFGHLLEDAEEDAYRVLRAHHVETADNEGSRGFTAPVATHGDLDKVLYLYLAALGGTSQLVQMNPRFTVRSFQARRLAQLLTEDPEPINHYLRTGLQPESLKLLQRYHVKNAAVLPVEIKPNFVLALALHKTPLAVYVYDLLTGPSAALKKMLSAYAGIDSLDTTLQTAVADGLNTYLLRDFGFYKKNAALLDMLALSDTTRQLLFSLNQELLRQKAAGLTNPDEKQRLLDALDNAEPMPSPVGDDLLRQNRLLLEAGFAPYFRASDIPSLNTVRQTLADELNRLLTTTDMFDPARFVESVSEQYPYMAKRFKNDPLILNRWLLESAYPNEIEKSYAPYRERMRNLIRVLRRGAATRQGIVDIVAANLGIIGDDPAAKAARTRIIIDEFAPVYKDFFQGPLRFDAEFEVNNTNPVSVEPEIWLTMAGLPAKTGIKGLANLIFEDTNSGGRVRFSDRIYPKDRLFLKGDTVLLNGIKPGVQMDGKVPRLLPGAGHWRFTADVVAADNKIYPIGRFDHPLALFDQSVWTLENPVIQVQIVSYKYTPGRFKVTVPWHIPGFTDKFEETEDHPRQQIAALVNKVKAAGILAQIAYVQDFREDHALGDRLHFAVRDGIFTQRHLLADKFSFESRQTDREDHNSSDRFILSGCLDYTSFDSQNTFA